MFQRLERTVHLTPAGGAPVPVVGWRGQVLVWKGLEQEATGPRWLASQRTALLRTWES